MRYIPIPHTALQPAALCLGTADMGSSIDLTTTFRMLDAYLAAGGNFLDTAQVYADWLPGERSISEKTLGQWMATRGNRDKVLIATKGAHPRLATMHLSRMSRADIEQDIHDSLRHLQSDYIDLYWLHRDDANVPVATIIDILSDQVQAGKIRHFGCSNWQTARIQAAQTYAAEQGKPGFVANQPLWNIGLPDYAAIGDPTLAMMDQAMWAYHQQCGLAAIPYSSQANGYFNKLAAGQSERIKTRTQRIYQGAANQQRAERIQQLARTTGLTVTQIVLGYLLAQPFPTIPIVGCQNMTQLQDSLSAAEVRLMPEQLTFLTQGA